MVYWFSGNSYHFFTSCSGTNVLRYFVYIYSHASSPEITVEVTPRYRHNQLRIHQEIMHKTLIIMTWKNLFWFVKTQFGKCLGLSHARHNASNQVFRDSVILRRSSPALKKLSQYLTYSRHNYLDFALSVAC